MYSAERRREILKMIERDAQVSVSDLAARFGVSRATVRRDLNHLNASGLLRRTYGGALASDEPTAAASAAGTDEASFSERQVSHFDEKERIGQFAAQLAQPGETIFIDGGTTTEYMVSYLSGKPGLTVVTFGLNIINRLVDCEDVTVIVIGGTLQHNSLTLGGILALDSMNTYSMRFDRAFLAAGGVSAAGGVTNPRLEQIPIKRRAIEMARQRILLADSSKIGHVATGLIAPVTSIHRLITTAAAPATEIEAIRAQGVAVDLI